MCLCARCDVRSLDTGIPAYNGLPHISCYAYWNGQDFWGLRNGVPINVLYFSGEGEDRTLHYPSAGVVMKRVKT